MTDIYVVHLSGKEKNIINRCDDNAEVIKFITSINKNSSYLENESFDSFEYNDERDDGVYVIKDGDFIKVILLETLCLTGYVYNSVYRVRKCTNSYELIKGEKDL